ncbi:phosphoribosylformylglycinamidine synthase [Thiohalobacter thiocyanaticus]|uniref:Phosphoribosylformylglycinamidine synthase n=1 Tax=Thiohalobacter thiocyanaticus TaxID=585455 RepID=A0A1Z4VRA2_9GAMM|nr:hypothetical protein [Thiohalobacter thiocyanaticus]BAZ94170.1 phosphoribosylformylglycinamidine synthase [Thiohalobacter thiocyanaticus]
MAEPESNPNDRPAEDENPYAVDKLISQARRLAADYWRATGKPLPGISAEIAENDAARLLDLELAEDRQAGFDAVGRGAREGRRIQIKCRTIFDESKSGHRLGQLKLDRDWDSVVLVLMDDSYEPTEIYEADRDVIIETIDAAAASKRSKRGPLSIARFKAIGRLVWTREEGVLENDEG